MTRPGDENAKADVDSGAYEARYKIKAGDRVLDLGAHVGNFSKMALEKVGPTGMVYAFEPHPENFEILLGIHVPNIMLFKEAAFDVDGMLVLHECKDNSGAHSLTHPYGGLMWCVETCDIGLAMCESNPSFIKIDTEGSEGRIVKSLLRAGIRCPMAIECHSNALFYECLEMFTEAKFTFEHTGCPVGICYATPL